MKYDFLVNGKVSLILSPENTMEEHLLKQLVKQELDIIEIRSQVRVVNKTLNGGLMISSKGDYNTEKDDPAKEKVV